MGILRILWDSVGIPGDSRGFSGFLEKVYEVSVVSKPSDRGKWGFKSTYYFNETGFTSIKSAAHVKSMPSKVGGN